jgi:hypothetical protein
MIILKLGILFNARWSLEPLKYLFSNANFSDEI